VVVAYDGLMCMWSQEVFLSPGPSPKVCSAGISTAYALLFQKQSAVATGHREDIWVGAIGEVVG
jgi:hypothetical protein